MSSKSKLVLGFDPGGIGQFGWSLVEATEQPQLIHSGISGNAAEAVDAVCKFIDDSKLVSAAGIDSPLFWVGNGDRQVDQIVRGNILARGAPNVWGTVQSVNSLRGACLVQGILTAQLLRARFPKIRITESHPKALLWLLGFANKQRRAHEVAMTDLSQLLNCESSGHSEHERDAALGAVAALAMLRKADGWRNLSREERDAFAPVTPVEYWMPIE